MLILINNDSLPAQYILFFSFFLYIFFVSRLFSHYCRTSLLFFTTQTSSTFENSHETVFCIVTVSLSECKFLISIFSSESQVSIWSLQSLIIPLIISCEVVEWYLCDDDLSGRITDLHFQWGNRSISGGGGGSLIWETGVTDLMECISYTKILHLVHLQLCVTGLVATLLL